MGSGNSGGVGGKDQEERREEIMQWDEKKGRNKETRKMLIKIIMVRAKHAPGTFEKVLYLQ